MRTALYNQVGGVNTGGGDPVKKCRRKPNAENGQNKSPFLLRDNFRHKTRRRVYNILE